MTDLVAALIARERKARAEIEQATLTRSDWAAIRRYALRDLHRELGTWRNVADATGQKLPTVHKAASQPRKKQQP